MRLDAHQHFWKYSGREYSWIRENWPIRRDFLPSDLEPLLTNCAIGGCIAVQARQSLDETRWLLELAEGSPFIQAVVGWVNLRSDRVEDQLVQFASHSKFAGVRHVVQDEPDSDFMLSPEFVRGVGKLARFKLTYDFLILPHQIPAAIALARRFPDQPFVVDHLAKPAIKAGAISPWREAIVDLARCPNVTCKLSGMVTEANWGGWTPRDFQPYLEVVFEAFGVERLMFGSDWPVCLLASTYEKVFAVVHDFLARLPVGVRDAVLGGNAGRFYLQNSPG